MQIVELPSDVMDSSEDIQFTIVVVDRVAVPNCRNFTLILQPSELIVCETEGPDIIESAILILSSEDIDILIVGCNGRAYSW